MPLHYRNKGCYPPRNPHFHPSVRCLSTTERRVGEGRFFFVSPPLSSFPLILFCLALCTAIACNCTRGVLALSCAEFRGRIGPTAKPRTMPGRAQRAGCRRDGRKHGGNCTETGSFSHRPPRSLSRDEHAACRRTVPPSCAGGGGKTRPRKRQMQGKNVICNDLCTKSACISKKKLTFAVELSLYQLSTSPCKKDYFFSSWRCSPRWRRSRRQTSPSSVAGAMSRGISSSLPTAAMFSKRAPTRRM